MLAICVRISAICGLGLVLAQAAEAADKVSIKTKTYSISGKTGAELYASMVRYGPRHGLLSRAIAQTSYKVDWDAKLVADAGVCRVAAAKPTLALTYAYPKPSSDLSPVVRQRWAKFMVGVRKHEETHGRLARQMVAAAALSVKDLQTAGDPTCRKTRAEVKRRASKVYALYEAKQIQFDKAEHRDRGNIDGLIRSLIKAK